MAVIVSSPALARRIDLALAVLRIAVGIVMIAHGAQKIFVFGLAGTTNAFTQMGVPVPAVTAPLVAVLELVGGIALVVGLLTRLAALGLAIDMLGAILIVHLKNGFFLPNGYEFALTLLAATLALAFAGGGAYSLDAMILGRRTERVAAV